MPDTITSAPPSNPLRFSLRTLLVLMTLAAIASGALFSQRSDRDEAIFILCWPVGLLAGIRLGRWRQRSGILEGALGGSISCVVASYLATKYSRPPWLDLSEYLALSIPAGLVLAGALAAIFWYLLDAPPLTGRPLRWFRIGSGVCLLFGVSGLIAWVYMQATAWSPRMKLPNPRVFLQTHPDARRIRAISPQGNYLALQAEAFYGSTQKLELFQVRRRRLLPLKIAALPEDAKSIAFSPDETWLTFLRSGSLQIVPLPGEQARSQSMTVGYPDYYDTGKELTISRDGQQIFACWHSVHVQRLQVFSRDKLRDYRNQHFTFRGQLSVSPSGKWLVKVHQPRTESKYGDLKAISAEIVRAADLRVVREHPIQATLDVPQDRPGNYFQHLQDVINEMFPESNIRLLSDADSLAVRGYAKDAEEGAQIVALVESQVNPTKKLPPGLSPPARLPVVGMLNDLSSIDRPLFDPDETCVAFDRRVLSLASASQGQTLSELPGNVVGLLPKGKALVIVEREPGWQTRIPFLRHLFPEGQFSQLCIVEISSGQIRKRSTPFRWCYQFQLAQNCLTAAALDGYNTLQIWDIPQLE